MRKFFTYILLLAFVIIFISSNRTSYALMCSGNPSLEEAYDWAALIFVWKVLENKAQRNAILEITEPLKWRIGIWDTILVSYDRWVWSYKEWTEKLFYLNEIKSWEYVIPACWRKFWSGGDKFSDLEELRKLKRTSDLSFIVVIILVWFLTIFVLRNAKYYIEKKKIKNSWNVLKTWK